MNAADRINEAEREIRFEAMNCTAASVRRAEAELAEAKRALREGFDPKPACDRVYMILHGQM